MKLMLSYLWLTLKKESQWMMLQDYCVKSLNQFYCNKVDNAMREKDAIEFYNLGLGEYYTLQVFQEVELRFIDALIDSFP
jgi:predicted GTPase